MEVVILKPKGKSHYEVHSRWNKGLYLTWTGKMGSGEGHHPARFISNLDARRFSGAHQYTVVSGKPVPSIQVGDKVRRPETGQEGTVIGWDPDPFVYRHLEFLYVEWGPRLVEELHRNKLEVIKRAV